LFSIYLDRYRIYAFAFGAIGASLIVFPVKNYQWLQTLIKKNTSIMLLLSIAIFVITGFTFSIATQQVYALLFALLIFSITASGIRFTLLNYRLFVYLGKISYGIYMLHPLVLISLFKVWQPNRSDILTSVGIAATGTLLTILLAAISYELFEKYFQRMARSGIKKSTG